MTPDRLIGFDRVLNFRDFGGYDTPAGSVARGMLFRSASFQDASAGDIARLNGLGVRFLVDLRRPEERAYEPNRWPGQDVRSIVNEEGQAAIGLPPHLAALLQSDLSAQSVGAYMRGIYREFAFDPRHIALYRHWFRELAEGGPGVLHCAAGKDRTGLGCALTLHALGVDEDTIFADYEYTNIAMNIDVRLPKIQARMEERLARKLDAAALRPMLSVDPAYLRTAFDAIADQYGSLDAYLENTLKVGPRERETLRERLIA